MYNGVKTLSLINDVGKIGLVHATKLKHTTNLYHTKNKQKWIKRLNVSYKTIRILEENIGSKISDISLGNLRHLSKAREIKEKEINGTISN